MSPEEATPTLPALEPCPETRDEVAWLIETRDHHGKPRWWGEWNSDGLCDWTFDSLKAIRFCRKEDAERAIAMAEWIDVMREDCSATEHAWANVNRRPAPSAAAGGVEGIGTIKDDRLFVPRMGWATLYIDRGNGAGPERLTARDVAALAGMRAALEWIVEDGCSDARAVECARAALSRAQDRKEKV